MRGRHTNRTPTAEIIRTFGPDYRLIFVGDAAMSPYEISHAGGSVEHMNEEAGQVWMERLTRHFRRAAWLNPSPQQGWGYTQSTRMIGELMEGRMFPLTLEGLDRMVKALTNERGFDDQGRILCGAVRFEVAGEPVSRACWCRVCQYIGTGSGTVNAVFASDGLAVTGETRALEGVADSGVAMTRRFCPKCGTHLFSNAAARPHQVVIRVGALDDPASFAPRPPSGSAPPRPGPVSATSFPRSKARRRR